MTLPALSGKATLDTSEFRQGLAFIKSSLATITEKPGTLKITADLRGAKQAITQIDLLRTSAAAPIRISADGSGLRDVSRIVKELQGQVKTVRDLWQTRAITDEEAALASQRLRNELLKLAAAEDAGANSVLKATSAAAQAQRTMNQARGEVTKGGFAFNASLGVLDALGKLGGPAGAAAGLIGKYVTDGLSGGISKGAPKVAEEVEGLSDDVIQALKRKLQIQSPSKVMEELGRFIIDGLIVGFKSGRDEMKAVLQEVAGDIPNTFSGGVFDDDLTAPLIDGLGSALSVIPELFAKSFADATEPAKEALADLGDEVEINVTTAFEGLGAGFEKASAALSGVALTADDTAESMNNVTDGTAEAGGAAVEAGNGFEKLGGFLAIAGAGIAAFGAALAVSLPKAAEFQTALRAISAESDLSAADLKEIGDGLLSVSNDMGISATALAEASYDIVGAGVKGAEANSAIVELARQSAELAGAGMTDVASAADTLTSALNAYDLSAVSAARVSDILFQTTNVGKISLQQMAGAMNEVFPLAAALGVNLETLGASVGALTSVGLPAAQAVTGIQSAFANILKPSAEASKAAQELGVGFDAATLKAKGLPKFLEDITVATKGNSAVMSQLFGDVNAVNAVFALTSEVGARKFTEALEQMASANGATAQGFAEVADSYEQAQQRFQNSIQNIQIVFASQFLPALTSATDATTAFIANIDDFGKNTVVQFAAVTGGAVLLANTFIKLSIAVKEAAAATALFQAVTAAGGIQAYLVSIGGLAGGMTTLATATLGATIAAAPLAVVALAVGTAFASWKLGKLIGELKLFGDETTTVNDKLTDFFAVTLFGADPQLIKGMREQEEAEQARALAAGDTADGYNDVASSVRAMAAAEAAAIEIQNKAAAAREMEINLLNAQKAALDDLSEALAGRKLKLTLTGKSALEKDLAELGKSYDDLREKASKPFESDLKNPELLAALKQLRTQQQAEEAALRKEAADDALKTAKTSALATQRAEIEAMNDGATKKKALRDQEIADIQRAAKQEVEGLSGFPKQQEQLRSDARKVIAAKQQGWAEEDRQLAIETGARVASAEKAARDAAIGAMEDGRAKREAVRNAELEDLKASIAGKVSVLEGDPESQRRVQNSGNREIAAKQQQQNRERIQEAKETAQLVVDAEASARDGTIAAMTDGRAKREAIRAAELLDLKTSIDAKIAALADDPEAQGRVQQAGLQQLAAKRAEQDRLRVAEVRETEKLVQAARDSARTAEISAIQDETLKRRAEREKEVSDFRQSVADRLEVLRDYPAQQQAVMEAAQQQTRAMQQRYAREDTLEATVRAQRIADAYLKAQDAQFSAQQAGQENQAAQYELTLARQLAAVKDNAVEGARIEAEALTQRAQFAEAQAQAQFSQDQKRLETTRILALSNTKLSADERIAIWQEFYAKLSELSGTFQADEKTRLAQQEKNAREAAANILQAISTDATRPIERSEQRVKELYWAQELSRSEAETLIINSNITTELRSQIMAIKERGRLVDEEVERQLEARRKSLTSEYNEFVVFGAGAAKVSAEDFEARKKKFYSDLQVLEDQASAAAERRHEAEADAQTEAQHTLDVALRDQEASGQALRQSTLDRLENEAEYAEKVARTTQQLEAARAAQLAVAQARLRELDGLIAAEGRETQRNALLDQRYGLLGKIADLTQREANAPIEADERRLRLYQAEAETRLIANGLGDNEVANANLTLQIASQRLLLANQRVAVASTLIELEAAQNDQAQVRLALAQAYAATLTKAALTPLTPPSITAFEDPLKKQAEKRQQAITRERELRQQGLDDLGRELDLQNRLQDVSEARTRALAQITRVGDDAVASAALELSLTRERLSLTDSQLRTGDLGAAGRAALLQKRVDLLTKEEAQQRQLNETRRASARLTEEVTLAESRLTEALAGTSTESNGVTVASRQIVESRRALTMAEREYAQARRDADQVGSIANLEKLKTATDAVAGAVGAQRTAIRNLAGEYRTLIGQMDGVRGAGEKLRQVAYGDATPFQADRERDRLSAITARRDAAQIELARALEGGKPELIARAAEELTKQQERYNAQLELLGKNGVKVDQTGKKETQRLADAVDSLGIQYDREAVALAERARITDQEAENVLKLQVVAQMFDASTTTLATSLEAATVDLANALKQDKQERDIQTQVDREIANINREIADKTAKIVAAPPVPTLPPRAQAQPTPFTFDLRTLDQLAARFAPPKLPAVQAVTVTAQSAKTIGLEVGRGLGAPLAGNRPNAVTSATNNYGGDTYNFTVNGAPGQSADAIADIAIRKLENRARRAGKGCPS